MKYILLILISIPLIYTFSYAKFSWTNKNKMGAIGAGLIAIASIVLTAYVLLFRD